ncbi:MAG: VWA domain-containing protein [Pyrinomonadaceae bacterium]|nr:VWA domain-containing protein [Pyrinomonadaceae bacterium]
MRSGLLRFAIVSAAVIAAASGAFGQSRHSVRGGVDLEGTLISVTAWRTDGKTDPIPQDGIYLYENGIEQRIKNFSYDPSPAKIVLLVDNSLTLAADTEKLKKSAMEFAYEIFDGDQLFVIAYDEKPEIIQEWTDDAAKLEASMGLFRKKGNPHLFDALSAASREVLQPLMPGTRKTAIVIIGDGLDRGSSTEFDKILAELQLMNITVYALQLPDRTGGAYRRNMPKAGAVISKLTEGTGGIAFPLDSAQEAAKAICDELRQRRYLLSYVPTNFSSYEPRRVFLTANEGINLRAKTAQPPNIK